MVSLKAKLVTFVR